MEHPWITYYVATSLDMYIAKPDGSVDWLFQEGDYGYKDFLAQQKALVMGATTYCQILSFGDWPYGDLPTYVFTNREDLELKGTTAFVRGETNELIARLGEEGLEKVWLVGGGHLAGQFLEANLIDELQLFIHPIHLGQGLPLFQTEKVNGSWKLADSKAYDTGLLHVTYRRSD